MFIIQILIVFNLGETDYETALRETEEEAGVKVDQLKIVPHFQIQLRYEVTNFRDGHQKPKIVTYYLAELEPTVEIIMSAEHQAFKWLGLEEAVELCGFEDMAEAFRTCHEKISETI